MKALTWILIIKKTKKEISRFYGTFDEAREYFLTLNVFDDYLDIVSLSGKSGF